MTTLLYSTGLDSELYRLLQKPEQLLFFKSGARYEKHEELQLREFEKRGFYKDQMVFVDDTLNFKKIELDNAIVPMRNIFYLLRALEYSDDILIGVTAYDLHYDKQPDVLSALTGFVQNYYYFRDVPETWENVRPSIRTPYREYTKGELLALAIEEGEDVSHIPTLRTCYDAHSIKGCGKCKSCVQKAIALAANKMFKPEYFDNDPRLEGRDWVTEFLEIAEGNIDMDVFKRELNLLYGEEVTVTPEIL